MANSMLGFDAAEFIVNALVNGAKQSIEFRANMKGVM